MADQIYNVRDPSGTVRQIKGPAGASDADVIAQAKRLFGNAPAADPASQIPDVPTQPAAQPDARQIGGVLGVRPRLQSGPDAGQKLIEGIDKLPYEAGGAVTDKLAGAVPSEVAAAAGTGANFLTSVATTFAGPPALKGAKIAKEAAPVVRAAARTGLDAVAKPFKSVISDLTGGKARVATEQAREAARGAAEQGASELEKQAAQNTQRGKAIGDVKQRLTAELDKARPAPANLDTQGSDIRKAFTDSIGAAKSARAKAADEQFTKVRMIAGQKEATGARVDTSGIETRLMAAAKEAEGVPELAGTLNRMLAAVRGDKRFEQLELARRYLNDIAYSSPMEGYSAIVKGEAKQIAHAVDDAMQKFVPEFKAYKDNYRVMSEPLESLGTRFGKAISTTEGGLQEDAYSKVANSDLPNRLFSKKEGVDTLIDALAGGKNAAPEARAAAEARVDKMVEHWILETSRQKPPSQALERLSSPQMRSVLTSAPKTEAALKKLFGDLSGMDKTATQLTEMAKDIGARGTAAKEAASKARMELQMADSMAAQLGGTSKKAAYSSYIASLKSARKANLIKEPQYQAALALIDRAATLEERTKLARKIATYVGASAGGYEIAKYAGVPGVH